MTAEAGGAGSLITLAPVNRPAQRRRQLALPVAVADPLTSAEALTETAINAHAVAHLQRGGGIGLAQAYVEHGMNIEDAALRASRLAKGHLAELEQVASYSARAGAFGSPSYAELSESPSSRHDLLVVDPTRAGARDYQVKVGESAYVARAANSGHHARILAPTQVLEECRSATQSDGILISDRIHESEVESRQIDTDKVQRQAMQVIEAELAGDKPCSWLNDLESATRSGSVDALTTFIVSFAWDFAVTLYRGEAPDILGLAKGAGKRAGLAFARKSIATYADALRLRALLAPGFSGQVIKRVGAGMGLSTAIADIAIRTGIATYQCLRGDINLSELLSRIGCEVATAGLTLALSAGAARLATRLGLPGWMVIALSIGGALAGSLIAPHVWEWGGTMLRRLAASGVDLCDLECQAAPGTGPPAAPSRDRPVAVQWV